MSRLEEEEANLKLRVRELESQVKASTPSKEAERLRKSERDLTVSAFSIDLSNRHIYRSLNT